MSSLIRKRLCSKNPLHNPILTIRLLLNRLLSSSSSSSSPTCNHTAPRRAISAQKSYGLFSSFDAKWRAPFGSNSMRFSTSQAAAESSTSDGLTVEGIIANNWVIYDEDESDWKSHAAAIAQSIHLIKKRLKWKKLIPKLELLSEELNKPDLWDDPSRAGKISREHGSIMSKMKGVNAFEQELFEHIDMIKLAREENDAESESVWPQFFS